MFSGKIVEDQQNVSIFGQAFASFRVLGSILLDKLIKRLLDVGLGLCLPDFMKIRFGFRLNALGHLVEDVGRLVIHRTDSWISWSAAGFGSATCHE